MSLSLHRRTMMQSVAAGSAALEGFAGKASAAVQAPSRPRAEPFPLEAVRLAPSDYQRALLANQAYLMRLQPDRLLHNFRLQAGLTPKGEVYGGWESESIAGHTLGHYLSAISLLHAQTGDPQACTRVAYIVSELALCQGDDGYVGALTYKHDGQMRPGREMFEQIRAGQIHSTGFDLNGAWSPLYVVHKLMAGLLDAQRYCGDAQALEVCARLGGYIDGVLSALDDAQLQQVLSCEYGGLNESYAELYGRTHDRRWLRAAMRIYDRKTLDPLAQGHDELANLHANTQIPKVIGLARVHELTGDPAAAVASQTFWDAVTQHHSYVIGGNADREYFSAPDTIASHVTEQTCESCNSYNMLKLTRMLYARDPQARYFDVYERTHLNHILAQQNPATGMMAYMTPLMSGTSRTYSTPENDFWCCVGTGMESHAKHGDSIWWRQGRDTLIVNLFIPSELTWTQDGSRFRLGTAYPLDGEVTVEVVGRSPARGRLTLALRSPGWARGQAQVQVAGRPVQVAEDADGYIRVRRRWRTGDRLTLRLPLRPRLEAAAGDPDTVALLQGPLVLAADLGPAGDDIYDQPAPVLVSADVLAALQPDEAPAGYRISASDAQPDALRFRPFAAQHDRRTAVYFKRFTKAGWVRARAQMVIDAAAQRQLQDRSVDVVHLGEMQAEHDHALESAISYPVVYRGRNGRDARSGGYFEVTMKARPGPLLLRATYWGEERNRAFTILVDGAPIVRVALQGDKPGVFFEQDYPIPPSLSVGRTVLRVRFQPDLDHTAGPVFGLMCLAAQDQQRI